MTKPIPSMDEIKSFSAAQAGNIEAVAAAAEAVLKRYEEVFEARGATHPLGEKKLTETEKTQKQRVRNDVLKDDVYNPNGVPRETHTDLRLLNNTLDKLAQDGTANGQDLLMLNVAGINLAYAKGLLTRAQEFTEIPGLFSSTELQAKLNAGLAAFEGEKGLDAAAARLTGATPENPLQGVYDAVAPVVEQGPGHHARKALQSKAAGQSPRTPGG